jgi:hypothetical protein
VEDSDVAWIDGEVLEVNGEDIKVLCTSGKTVRMLCILFFKIPSFFSAIYFQVL